MIPVTQKIVSPVNGDCLRAAMASLFDVELEDAPDFQSASGAHERGKMIQTFVESQKGGKYRYLGQDIANHESLMKLWLRNVEGFAVAIVPSKNFEAVYHAVIMDMTGQVVHDPTPVEESSYVGVNIVAEQLLKAVYLIQENK